MPLNTLALAIGSKLPVNEKLFELKFGLMSTDALLLPLFKRMFTCADIPTPITFIETDILPFLSVVCLYQDIFPLTVMPPRPLGPLIGILKAT